MYDNYYNSMGYGIPFCYTISLVIHNSCKSRRFVCRGQVCHFCQGCLWCDQKYSWFPSHQYFYNDICTLVFCILYISIILEEEKVVALEPMQITLYVEISLKDRVAAQIRVRNKIISTIFINKNHF